MQPLDAFLSKPDQRMLDLVLMHPERDYGTLELLERMDNGRGAGSKVLKRWLDCGLLRERRVGNQRRLSANPGFVLYPELRQMVRKTIGLAAPLGNALRPLASRLSEAFVFGSVAAGKDTDESDIDVALVGDVSLFDVSHLLDVVEIELGRPIHANVYSPSEWQAESPVLAAIKGGPRMDLMDAIHGSSG